LNSSLTDNTVLITDSGGSVDFVGNPTILWRSPNGVAWTADDAGQL
jgi:hypothetical protein